MKKFLAIYNVYCPRSRMSRFSKADDSLRKIYMTVNAPETATRELVSAALKRKDPKVGEYESVELEGIIDMDALDQINLQETVGLKVQDD